jgi:hypothetical protein
MMLAGSFKASRVVWCALYFCELLGVVVASQLYIFMHFLLLKYYAYAAADCLCGLVVRLPGCRPRGSGFDSRHCQIF